MREHDPAVAVFGDTPQRHVLVPTKPQGYAPPGGERIDAGVIDRVPLALVGDVRLRPQRVHDGDLLLLALAAVVEGHVEADVLDGVPADPDAEAEASAREHV